MVGRGLARMTMGAAAALMRKITGLAQCVGTADLLLQERITPEAVAEAVATGGGDYFVGPHLQTVLPHVCACACACVCACVSYCVCVCCVDCRLIARLFIYFMNIPPHPTLRLSHTPPLSPSLVCVCL